MTAFENDYLRKFLLRQKRADLNVGVARVVEPDSIIFTSTQNNFYGSPVDRRVGILGEAE